MRLVIISALALICTASFCQDITVPSGTISTAQQYETQGNITANNINVTYPGSLDLRASGAIYLKASTGSVILAAGTAFTAKIIPSIIITQPADNSSTTSVRPVLTVTVALSQRGVDRTSLKLAYDNGVSFSPTVLWTPTNPAENGGTFTYTPNVDLVSGLHTIAVSLNDLKGNKATVKTTFTVLSPNPVIASLTPPAALTGSADTIITVVGSNFFPGALIQFNSNNVITTFVNSTQLSATIPASLLSTPGNFDVIVKNQAPNAGTSTAFSFVVANAPSVPTLLTAIATAGSTVNLTWIDNSNNETGFVVERKTGATGTYTLVASTGPGATTTVDTSALRNRIYTYHVKAVNSGISSEWSNEVTLSSLADSYLISTVAGNGTGGFNADGGLATNASLFLPAGVTVDYLGNIYIADTANQRLRRIDVDTGDIQTIAGTGTAGFSGDGNSATLAALSSPKAVVLDAVGNIYVADTGNNRIRMIDSLNGNISTVAGTGISGYGGDGGLATAATLSLPVGLGLSSDGNLLIVDRGNNRIRKIATDGTISTIAGTGIAGFSGDSGLAINAQLSGPTSIAAYFDTIYVIDSGNARLRSIAPDGSISTISGTGVQAFSGDGGLAAAATLDTPTGIAVDVFGNLFISEADHIRMISTDDSTIHTLTGQTTPGFLGDGSYALQASIGAGSYSLASQDNGDILFTDTANQRIRKLSNILPPATPQNLRAVASATPSVTLSWTDSSNNESQFVIERSVASGSFTEIARIAANAITWTDLTVSANTLYAYRIYSINTAGASDYSNLANAKPDGNAPPTIAVPIQADGDFITEALTTLTVLGADDGGEQNLTYSWTADSSMVTFASNNSNVAKNTSAIFQTPGEYTLTVTIADAGGLTVTDTIFVAVLATPRVVITPDPVSMGVSTTRQFTGIVEDQFGILVNKVNPALQTPFWLDGGVGITTTTSAQSSPDGYNNAVLLVGNNVDTEWKTVVSEAQSNLNGKAMTVSVWLKSGSGGHNVDLTLSLPGSVPDHYTQTTTVTTSWAQYTFTQNVSLTTIGAQPAYFIISHGNGHNTYAWSAQVEEGESVLSPIVSWNVDDSSGGTITAAGTFTSGLVAGHFHVVGTCGPYSGASAVTVTNSPPNITDITLSSESPVTQTFVDLTGIATDDGGDANLKYYWSVLSPAPGAVTISASGTNASKNTRLTFVSCGTYTVHLIVADGGGKYSTMDKQIVVVPSPKSMTISPPHGACYPGGQTVFTAVVLDQFGLSILQPPQVVWETSNYLDTILDGTFSPWYADTEGSIVTVTANCNGLIASADATVTNNAPYISYVFGSPNPVFGTSSVLGVYDDDYYHNKNYSYKWEALIGPAPVTFTVNDASLAYETTAKFTQCGTYKIQLTVTNEYGYFSNSMTLSIDVNSTLTVIAVEPANVNLNVGDTQQFTATGRDQFGKYFDMSANTNYTWSVDSGGTIIPASGLFTATTVTSVGGAKITYGYGYSPIQGIAYANIFTNTDGGGPPPELPTPPPPPQAILHTPNIGLDTPYDGTIYNADSKGNVTFSGKIDADYDLSNISVNVYVDGKQQQSVYPRDGGSFTADVNLEEGKHTVFMGATAINSETGAEMTAFSTDRDVWVDTQKPDSFKITGPNFTKDYYYNNPWIWGYDADHNDMLHGTYNDDWANGFTARTRFRGIVQDNGVTPTMPYKVTLGADQTGLEPSSFSGFNWEAELNLVDESTMNRVVPNVGRAGIYGASMIPSYSVKDAALNTTMDQVSNPVYWCPIILNPKTSDSTPTVKIAIQKGDQILAGITGGVPDTGAGPVIVNPPSGLTNWYHQDDYKVTDQFGNDTYIWRKGDPWIAWQLHSLDPLLWDTWYAGYGICTNAEGSDYSGSDHLNWNDDGYFGNVNTYTGPRPEGPFYDVVKLKYDTPGLQKKLEFQNFVYDYNLDGHPVRLYGFDEDPDYRAEVSVFDFHVDLILADGTHVSDSDRRTKEFPFRVDNDDVDENGVPDYMDDDYRPGDQNLVKVVVSKLTPDLGPSTPATFAFHTSGLSAFDGGGRVFRVMPDGSVALYTGDDISNNDLPVTFLWQGGKYGMMQGKGVYTLPLGMFNIQKKLEFDLRGHEVEPTIRIPRMSAEISSREIGIEIPGLKQNFAGRDPWEYTTYLGGFWVSNSPLQRVVGEKVALSADISGLATSLIGTENVEWFIDGQKSGQIMHGAPQHQLTRDFGAYVPFLPNDYITKDISIHWMVGDDKSGAQFGSSNDEKNAASKNVKLLIYKPAPNGGWGPYLVSTKIYVEHPYVELQCDSSPLYTFYTDNALSNPQDPHSQMIPNSKTLSYQDPSHSAPGILVYPTKVRTGTLGEGNISYIQTIPAITISNTQRAKSDKNLCDESPTSPNMVYPFQEPKYETNQKIGNLLDVPDSWMISSNYAFDGQIANYGKKYAMQDSPGMHKLPLNIMDASYVAQFSTWFMYKPTKGKLADNIPVPIKVINWNISMILKDGQLITSPQAKWIQEKPIKGGEYRTPAWQTDVNVFLRR